MFNARIFVFMLLFCGLSFSSTATLAQSRPDTLMRIPMIYGSAGYDIAGGDMAKRFGNNFEVGAGFLYKSQNNWLFGMDMNYLFGEKVKENVISNLVNSDGYIIGKDGLYADVRISERGIKLPVFKAGKLWSKPFFNASVNSGFVALLGAGFMQHQVNFEDVSRTVNQLDGEYRKGYDRLTNGLALTQNLGYMYFSKNHKINFFVMAEVTEGFTKSRRDFDFSTMQKDNRNRTDLLYGIKVGWIFPIYKKLPEAYYYN